VIRLWRVSWDNILAQISLFVLSWFLVVKLESYGAGCGFWF
jgi:hypothetical protein